MAALGFYPVKAFNVKSTVSQNMCAKNILSKTGKSILSYLDKGNIKKCYLYYVVHKPKPITTLIWIC